MSTTKLFRGIPLAPQQLQVARHIQSMDDFTDQLRDLQASWNNLGLLGELTNIGADITQTRERFHQLACDLSQALIDQSVQKVSQELSQKAQNSIDILVRNLFERTADIGFLAIDAELASYAKQFTHQDTELHQKIRRRMRDYVQKYSVYQNVLLIGLDGQLLIDLTNTYTGGTDCSWLTDQIKSSRNYLEYYGKIDQKFDPHHNLVYGWPIQLNNQKQGYVALQFNLADEVNALFKRVLPEQDEIQSWIIAGAVDAQGRVIFSSDESTLRTGQQLKLSANKSWCITQIGPFSYLGCLKQTQGYQGYYGPGWFGFSLAPIHQAFNSTQDVDTKQNNALLIDWNKTENLLDPKILSIQTQAIDIQKQLNRSVWNGNISQRQNQQRMGEGFTKTLLWEISRAGERTRNLFAQFIEQLLETVGNSFCDKQRFAAILAIDIMDRNLYERANDCRWWALTDIYDKALKDPSNQDVVAQAKKTLVHTNSLYTVYTDILLINKQGKIIANSGQKDRTGETIQAEWLNAAFKLRNQNDYTVSAHEISPLYDNKATYIYCAPIYDNRHDPKNTLGAIAVVFDGEPQFEAILNEAIDTNSGSLAYIVDEHKNVISSNTDLYIDHQKLTLHLDIFHQKFKEEEAYSGIIEIDSIFYAMGACRSGSYREYKSKASCYHNHLTCLYLKRIGPKQFTELTENSLQFEQDRNENEKSKSIEVATFKIGHNWYGIEASHIDGATTLRNLAKVPNSPAWQLGTMLLDGEAISIIQLHSELNQNFEGLNLNTEIQLILLKSNFNNKRVGIYVNDLGEIPNISETQIQSSTELSQERTIVSMVAHSNDKIMNILDPSFILEMTGIKKLADKID